MQGQNLQSRHLNRNLLIQFLCLLFTVFWTSFFIVFFTRDLLSPYQKFDHNKLNHFLKPELEISTTTDSVYVLVSYGIWQDGHLIIMGTLNYWVQHRNKIKLKVIAITTDEKEKVDLFLNIQGGYAMYNSVFLKHNLALYLYYLGVRYNSNPDMAGDFPIFAVVKNAKLLFYARGDFQKNLNIVDSLLTLQTRTAE